MKLLFNIASFLCLPKNLPTLRVNQYQALPLLSYFSSGQGGGGGGGVEPGKLRSVSCGIESPKLLCLCWQHSSYSLTHSIECAMAFSLVLQTHLPLLSSLIPRLSRNVNMYRRQSLVSFLRKHDVIKIGLKQKGNILRVVQPTML